MKNITDCKQRQVNGFAPGFVESELLHLDGKCFHGQRGLLAVALQPASIVQLPKSWPSHWLIPLEDVAMVRRAESLPGEVLWLSSRPPVEVVGHLSEDVRGAWVDAGRIVVNLDGHPRRLNGSPPPLTMKSLPQLAAAVVDVWKGNRQAPRSAPAFSRNSTNILSLCAA